MSVNFAINILGKAFMMFIEIFLQLTSFCVPDRSSSYAGSMECKQLMLGCVIHVWTCNPDKFINVKTGSTQMHGKCVIQSVQILTFFSKK